MEAFTVIWLVVAGEHIENYTTTGPAENIKSKVQLKYPGNIVILFRDMSTTKAHIKSSPKQIFFVCKKGALVKT